MKVSKNNHTRSKQGKSFVLNFFLRYLHIKYKLKKKNMSNWMNLNDSPLSGFSWKAGSVPHTVGILIWSEIFLAALPSGEEVAIILMDTQGSFDNETTITNCATIFGLSALLSSVQIYNLKENIKQCDLSHLECFSGFGQLIGGSNEYPFQKLLFLIRDWSFAFEKQYGYEGGKKLLKEVLNTDLDQCQGLISLKNYVKENFNEIECFLLPHPGVTVATSETFQGNLEEIDGEFRKQVGILVETVLKPENLVPKRIKGELITLEELVHLIRNYEKCFRDEQIPSLQSLFLATAEVHHTSAIHETEQMYKALLNNCKSQDEADQIKSEVLDHFHKKKKMGTPALKKKYEDLLNQRMEEIFHKYRSSFEKFWNWTPAYVSGAASGTAVAGASVMGGIVQGAIVSEIVVVSTFAGVVGGVVGLVVGFAIVGTIGTVRLLIRKTAPPRENRNESDGNNLGCRDDTRDGELLSGNEEADTATNLQSNRAENCQQIQVSVSNESDGNNLGCRDDTRDGELLSGNEEADTATNLQSNRAENCQQIQVSVSNAILFVAVAVIVMVMQWLWQWEVTN
ncbi:hypothetical protein MTP99_005512 [Tenebrio molitor]|nr:hypothetical protein MTP99_005512 [Tenebrio molitor]